MTVYGLIRLLSTAALVLTTAVGSASVPAALAGSASDSRSAVCAAVADCRVVASADVDGDGRRDRIGWHQVSDDVVQIRVRNADGALLTKRVGVHFWWGGGAWGGAARVDDRAGAELLVGSMQGAHTPMYTMLTYRAGALVVEASPSPLSSRWQVDAAYGDYLGWWRHRVDGGVAMTQQIAYRDADGTGFTGRDVTYRRSATGWVRGSVTRVTYPTERAAAVIGGFHISGLEAFPGLG